MGELQLTIQPAGGGAPSLVRFEQPQVKLGRGSRCEIRLPFQIVSSHHLTFLNEKGGYKVIDVGSTNGTYLNGVRLEPNVPTPISSGNELRIVDLTIRIEIESLLCEGFTLAESTIMLRQMMSEVLRPKNAENRETAFLEFSAGLGRGRRVMLPDNLKNGWIGSAADSLVHVNHPEISARIGEIKRNGDGYGIELVEGGELIHVNGASCQALQPLRSGDRISIGNVELTFHDPLEAHLAALDIQRPLAASAKEEPASAEAATVVEPEKLLNAEMIQEVAVRDSSVPAEREQEDTQTEAPGREPLGLVELGLIALSCLLMLAGLVLFLYIFEII